MVDSRKIAVLGAGRIGESLISGLLSSGWREPSEVAATTRRAERVAELRERYGIEATLSNRDAAAGAALVVIAVKPQDIEGLLGEIGQDHAGRERRATTPDDCDARFAGVLRRKGRELLAEASGLVELERRRLGSWVVFRHRRTAGDQQDDGGQQGAVLRDTTNARHDARISQTGG